MPAVAILAARKTKFYSQALENEFNRKGALFGFQLARERRAFCKHFRALHCVVEIKLNCSAEKAFKAFHFSAEDVARARVIFGENNVYTIVYTSQFLSQLARATFWICAQLMQNKLEFQRIA
ncbi:hypothetical protein D6817_03770 [Candidatus Pacearchaeota archaeon]|nr:MAG: hypothetical protein D6817_03770 [Candidatus Pacearchaeota archaeon]